MASATTDRRLGIISSKAIKVPCDLATTGNITLSGEQTIGGVTTNESRALVWQQTDASENGIYDTSTGEWTRALDANKNTDFAKGTLVAVTGGTYADCYFHITSNDPIDVDVDDIDWEQDLTNTSNALRSALASTASSTDGDALLGVLSPLTGGTARTQHDKNRDFVSIFDFLSDAQKADVRARTFSLNLGTTLAAAFANGGRFFAPVGGYGLPTGFTIPSSVEILGEHPILSEFKHVFGADGNFICIENAQNTHVRNVRINGNATARAAVAGFAIAIYNTETTSVPRRNNCSIRDCYVDSDGFTAIYASNAHDFQILNNRVTGDKDSGIAVCVGSSSFLVEGNIVDGFEFQISASSDGNTDYATTGAVRNGIICKNIVRATKAGGMGLQFDGLQRVNIHLNDVTVDGGDTGMQVRFSTGTGTGTDVIFEDSHLSHNTITLAQDITTTSIEISGTGDIRSSSIDHNIIKGAATKVNTLGIVVGNGVKVRLEENKARLVAQALQIDTGDVASNVEVIGMVATGCTIGINSPASYANKCELSLVDCSISGSSTADYNLGSNINLTSRNTAITVADLANVNVYKGDLAVEYAQQTGATYTVRPVDLWLDANRAGTITYTLPSASTYKNRELNFRTIQAQTVVSASSNVVTQSGGGPGTAILAATAGKWARLMSDGTNWQIMASN